MTNFVKTKKITLALMMLIALTSLITFNACKEDVVNPNNPISENDEAPGDYLHDLLGDSPVGSFRFYTRTSNFTMPIGPYTEADANKNMIFHGFNASILDGEWHSYKPKYLKLNGEDWPFNGGVYSLHSGQHGYIEDLNVVMEYKGTEFRWDGKNIPEVKLDSYGSDTIEIDRSKTFYLKYSGGNSGSTKTTLHFGGDNIQTEDNGNITISPETLKAFAPGVMPIAFTLSRHLLIDTTVHDTTIYNGGEVQIAVDNIQTVRFLARFK